MKVILRQEIKELGKAGEVVEVAGGYARNYLIPNKIAYRATAGNLKRLQEEEKLLHYRERREVAGMQTLADKLNEVSLTFVVKAGDDDRLFGSITSQDITGKLAEQGFEIDRKKVHFEEPIKTLGVYTVPIKLHQEVEALVKVWVVRE